MLQKLDCLNAWFCERGGRQLIQSVVRRPPSCPRVGKVSSGKTWSSSSSMLCESCTVYERGLKWNPHQARLQTTNNKKQIIWSGGKNRDGKEWVVASTVISWIRDRKLYKERNERYMTEWQVRWTDKQREQDGWLKPRKWDSRWMME